MAAPPYPPGPPGPPVPAASASPSSKVELNISCKDLYDADVFSKSDPIAVVYARSGSSKDYVEVCAECLPMLARHPWVDISILL